MNIASKQAGLKCKDVIFAEADVPYEVDDVKGRKILTNETFYEYKEKGKKLKEDKS